jgi:hypothetical protein
MYVEQYEEPWLEFHRGIRFFRTGAIAGVETGTNDK